MKRSFIPLFVAASMATAPVVAFAQMTDISRVESEVTSDLALVGINDIDVSMLTLKQLQEIKLVAGGQSGMTDKQRQIRAIIDRAPGSQSE
ncbi:hypothetical protein [uncultured Amaricoccus sp.]|uniref:hypothetical protein n=1 Tax=uncultured Amaricoccus sp. TaxID=339341 RepID=UPI0026090B83|nr:hypothetical protein [uncultured Amaricoccus sp.]